MSRMRTPTSVPPGSRVRTTVRPARAATLQPRGLRGLAGAVAAFEGDPEPAGHFFWRPACAWSSPGGSCAWARALGALVRQHLHRDLERDVIGGLATRDGHIRGAVGDVRAEPAVLDADGLARHGSASNSLRKLAARFAYFGCA
jgi:hypothetical protein